MAVEYLLNRAVDQQCEYGNGYSMSTYYICLTSVSYTLLPFLQLSRRYLSDEQVMYLNQHPKIKYEVSE